MHRPRPPALHYQVRQAQQMSTLVARKKSELAAKLQRLQERRDALAAQLDSSGSSKPGGSTAGGISDDAWRAKYEAIKAKLPAYKNMKRELAELEAEVGLWDAIRCDCILHGLPP